VPALRVRNTRPSACYFGSVVAHSAQHILSVPAVHHQRVPGGGGHVAVALNHGLQRFWHGHRRRVLARAFGAATETK